MVGKPRVAATWLTVPLFRSKIVWLGPATEVNANALFLSLTFFSFLVYGGYVYMCQTTVFLR